MSEVVGIRAVIGYLHTGFEKNMEHKTWWKAITYPERIDYVSFQYNELVFVLAIEKLLAMEVPQKATWMRTLLTELTRIHSHLIFLGTSALELGAISMFWYCFRERDLILDLFEMVCGTRMHTRYFQAGGLAEDIPRGFYPECRKFVEWMPKAIDEYEAMLTRNEIWLERTQGIGPALGRRRDRAGPVRAGAARIGGRLGSAAGPALPRLSRPSTSASRSTTSGDVYDRYRVRMDEMRESVRIVEQCLEGMPEGPWIADDRKVVLPPRHELHTSMESLIHHFKIVTEGYRVPEGEVYVTVESPRGEMGCYVVSDGGPEAVAGEVPCAVVRRARGDCDLHDERADRGLDRDRRLSGLGHGGGRPVSSLQDEIREAAKPYPDQRSAVMSGLRLAQREYGGWLPREALEEVADALDLTPAHVQAVASFYDMYHLAPVGEHLVEVCTNVSCALVGAQQVVEAFEQELGIAVGETSEDGKVTLRTIECAGGCGYAPVVVVDHRYREPTRPEDVPGIVAELGDG